VHASKVFESLPQEHFSKQNLPCQNNFYLVAYFNLLLLIPLIAIVQVAMNDKGRLS